jgi:probable HAF family extracellular repeat protein
MKSAKLMCITAIALFAALAMPLRLAAQDNRDHKHARYSVQDLGTLGGIFSWATGINNKGWVNGFSTLPGDHNQHAVLWLKGSKIDLLTLGGPNSGAEFGGDFGPNESGEVAGPAAETSTPDPLGEDFCGYGTHLICLGFLWRNGVMMPLPTLGGNNGASTGGNNNRGEIVGEAENTTSDPTCLPPQVLQFRPVIWKGGKIEELPTFPGDPDGQATGINDHGQIVGASGSCTASASHALLWQKGTATNLGSLGGALYTFPLRINNQGQVVGQGNLTGDNVAHAFLWTRDTGIQDLGTLPGDLTSLAGGINSRGQVAGFSCDINDNCRAFLWQNGAMTDLNTLIPPESPLYLVFAVDINSRGQIVGIALRQSTGETHAFLATPCDGEECGEKAAGPAANRVTPAATMQTSTIANQNPRLGGLADPIRRPFGRRLAP